VLVLVFFGGGVWVCGVGVWGFVFGVVGVGVWGPACFFWYLDGGFFFMGLRVVVWRVVLV